MTQSLLCHHQGRMMTKSLGSNKDTFIILMTVSQVMEMSWFCNPLMYCIAQGVHRVCTGGAKLVLTTGLWQCAANPLPQQGFSSYTMEKSNQGTRHCYCFKVGFLLYNFALIVFCLNVSFFLGHISFFSQRSQNLFLRFFLYFLVSSPSNRVTRWGT